MKPTLAPCPLCGGQAESKYNADYYASYEHTIECISCGLLLPVDSRWSEEYHDFIPEDEYVSRWNTRQERVPNKRRITFIIPSDFYEKDLEFRLQVQVGTDEEGDPVWEDFYEERKEK